MKTIENVIVTEINNTDVIVSWSDNPKDTRILRGINRPKNVQIGDIGKLTYKATGFCNLWWFSK